MHLSKLYFLVLFKILFDRAGLCQFDLTLSNVQSVFLNQKELWNRQHFPLLARLEELLHGNQSMVFFVV